MGEASKNGQSDQSRQMVLRLAAVLSSVAGYWLLPSMDDDMERLLCEHGLHDVVPFLNAERANHKEPSCDLHKETEIATETEAEAEAEIETTRGRKQLSGCAQTQPQGRRTQ